MLATSLVFGMIAMSGVCVPYLFKWTVFAGHHCRYKCKVRISEWTARILATGHGQALIPWWENHAFLLDCLLTLLISLCRSQTSSRHFRSTACLPRHLFFCHDTCRSAIIVEMDRDCHCKSMASISKWTASILATGQGQALNPWPDEHLFLLDHS